MHMERKKALPQKQNRNTVIPLPTELMNGQSLGAVSGMKFGLGSIGHCGCEVVAVYNALLLSGTPRPFTEVAKYMERFSMLGGLWGTDPYALGHCLRHFGLGARKLRSHESVKRVLMSGKRVIYVYWIKRRMMSGIHTVCAEQRGDTLYVYNAYSNVDHAIETKPDLYFRRKMLTAYEVIPPTL